MQISYTWALDAHWLISTYQLRARLQASLFVGIVCVLSSLEYNLYRLLVASLTAGLNIVPITENSPWCLVKAREGTSPVTIVTSVPWERERDITEVAVLAARPAKRRSVSDSDVIVACTTFYTASQLVSICMRCAYFATIGQSFDWREPIGLQERLEGRSSHNGEFSLMSRSRSQGTEVTIVTGDVFRSDDITAPRSKCCKVLFRHTLSFLSA